MEDIEEIIQENDDDKLEIDSDTSQEQLIKNSIQGISA